MAKQNFTYNFPVEAETKDEAVAILNQLAILNKKLSLADLKELASLSNSKPNWVEKAKKYKSFL